MLHAENEKESVAREKNRRHFWAYCADSGERGNERVDKLLLTEGTGCSHHEGHEAIRIMSAIRFPPLMQPEAGLGCVDRLLFFPLRALRALRVLRGEHPFVFSRANLVVRRNHANCSTAADRREEREAVSILQNFIEGSHAAVDEYEVDLHLGYCQSLNHIAYARPRAQLERLLGVSRAASQCGE